MQLLTDTFWLMIWTWKLYPVDHYESIDHIWVYKILVWYIWRSRYPNSSRQISSVETDLVCLSTFLIRHASILRKSEWWSDFEIFCEARRFLKTNTTAWMEKGHCSINVRVYSHVGSQILSIISLALFINLSERDDDMCSELDEIRFDNPELKKASPFILSARSCCIAGNTNLLIFVFFVKQDKWYTGWPRWGQRPCI